VQYALDRGTRILGLSLNDGTAVIELDSEGLDRIHGRPFSELAFWSLVFTMTEAPGIESVTLVKDGTPLAALGDPPFTLPTQASRSQARGCTHGRSTSSLIPMPESGSAASLPWRLG